MTNEGADDDGRGARDGREGADDDGGDAPEPAFATRCVRAVVALHDRFEGWLSGRADDDPTTFAPIEASLADSFRIVPPSGDGRGYDDLISGLRAGHGSRSPGFSIEVRDVAVRDVSPDGDRCLVAYEEWQSDGTGEGTGRLSTALFAPAPAAPDGVAWLHVHETWLPGAGPDGADAP